MCSYGGGPRVRLPPLLSSSCPRSTRHTRPPRLDSTLRVRCFHRRHSGAHGPLVADAGGAPGPGYAGSRESAVLRSEEARARAQRGLSHQAAQGSNGTTARRVPQGPGALATDTTPGPNSTGEFRPLNSSGASDYASARHGGSSIFQRPYSSKPSSRFRGAMADGRARPSTVDELGAAQA